MPNHAFEQMNFPRYERWISRTVGADLPFIIFDKNGIPLWGNDVPHAKKIGLMLEDINNHEAGIHRHDLNAYKTVLYQSLDMMTNERLGWVAFIVNYFENHKAPMQVNQLMEMMDDFTDSIIDEYKIKTDFELMYEKSCPHYDGLHSVCVLDKPMLNISTANDDRGANHV